MDWSLSRDPRETTSRASVGYWSRPDCLPNEQRATAAEKLAHAVRVCRHAFTNTSFSQQRLNHISCLITQQTALIRKLAVLTPREQEGGMERKSGWRKRNWFPLMHFTACFISRFFSCALCLVWALARSRVKPHDAHAAFSPHCDIYIHPEEAFFLYGPGYQKTAHATYWGSSLLVGARICQMTSNGADWPVEEHWNMWECVSPTPSPVFVLAGSISKWAVDH